MYASDILCRLYRLWELWILWLSSTDPRWLIIPDHDIPIYAYYIDNFSKNFGYAASSMDVYPTFYINGDYTITGTSSLNHPYILQ